MSRKIILIGEKYLSLLQKSLIDLEMNVIPVPDNPLIDRRLSGHTDLSVCYPGRDVIFLAPYLKGSAFAQKLRDLGLSVLYPNINQSPLYPNDAQMNISIADNTAFFNRKTASREISEYLRTIGLNICEVRQGYTKCSICVLPAGALITADRGVAEAAERVGFDCLLIEPGYVELPGFEYGFIGGASFVLDGQTVAFTGKLDDHPDSEKILGFLGKYHIRAEFLTDMPIFDIGSAVII